MTKLDKEQKTMLEMFKLANKLPLHNLLIVQSIFNVLIHDETHTIMQENIEQMLQKKTKINKKTDRRK